MKPFQILIFLVSVSFSLIGLSLVFPNEGIKLGTHFTLDYPRLKDILGLEKLAKNEQVDSIISNQLELLKSLEVDTLSSLLPPEGKPIIKSIHIDTLKHKIHKIEFNQMDKTLLHTFFKKLQLPEGTLRVLHYGDSQIEGDRISSFLRTRLQSTFGGSGVGYVEPKPLVERYTIKQTRSENWMRFPIFGPKDAKVTHNRYGGFGIFFRYAMPPDTSLPISEKPLTAQISFNLAQSSPANHLTILYGNAQASILTEISANGQSQVAKYLNTQTKISKLHHRFASNPLTIDIQFTGSDSPDIYAMFLDGGQGVAVDNIPLRGCSGTFFNKMDYGLLSSFYQNLNVGLILVEYGGNVVPGLETEKGVDQYTSWFYSQLRTIRKIAPNAPIIVIGPADMSKKDQENYVTYPLLPYLRDGMRNSALKAGAYYWDMYEAMGGYNAMPQWVNGSPKLATDDYVHFTPGGAKLIGNMFYNALMYEYEIYHASKK